MNLDFDFTPAFGEALGHATLRQTAQDFIVHEELSFPLVGSGDHIYLYIEKTGCNTDWVAKQLAKIAGLKSVDIGYAGLKDRHAVTRQWFSLHLPGKPEPDWFQLSEGIVILENTRHQKKLKTGAIKQNCFIITLRNVTADDQAIIERLQKIKQQGFPNYFGSQRFGFEQGNVNKLLDMVENRKRLKPQKRGIFISSGRSYLFNQILKQRILDNTWNRAVEGDVMNLDGSRGVFVPESYDTVIDSRIQQMDIHPATVLWGRGRSQTRGPAQQLEQQCIENNIRVAQALENAGAAMAYRAMRVRADDLEWHFDDTVLQLKFSLPSGAYATSLIHELINIEGASDSPAD